MAALYKKYREVILYGFFGVLTTLVNWGAYWILADVARVPYLASTVIAQVLAILFAYVTNRKWVFESKAQGPMAIGAEMLRFFGARGAALLLDLGCMYVGVDLLHINDKLMKLLANVVVVITNYSLSKLFVFKAAQAGKDAK